MQKLRNTRWGIIALFLAGGLFMLAAYLEGDFDLIGKSSLFLLLFTTVFAVCFVTSLNVNYQSFVWLLVFGFFVGLITQMIGTFNNPLSYEGNYKSYVSAGFLWAFSAAAMLGLSLAINKVLPEIKGRHYNVASLSVLFLVIPVFLGRLRTAVDLNFWIYYFSIFVFCAVATYRLKFSVLLSLVLAAWIMGYVSECMGSEIGLWRFCAVPKDPETVRSVAYWSAPPYLTFGCRPLIFLTQVGLSFFLSQEHLNMRPEGEASA
jgi:hypothetical protein